MTPIREVQSTMKKRYQYSCVNCPNIKELFFIIDHAMPIQYQTFRRNVDSFVSEWNQQYSPFTRKNDPLISFYYSTTPQGKKVYYFVWSAIEYVFS